MGARRREILGREFLLRQLLNRTVFDGSVWSGRSQRHAARASAVADIFSGDAVFSELIHQPARENEVEERIQVRDNRALGRLLPFGAPKNGEDLDGSEQRPSPVGKPGRGCRGHAVRLRAMEWHDPDGVLHRGGGFRGTRLDGHEALLVRTDEFRLRGLERHAGWNSHGTERCEKCKWDFAPGVHAAGRDLLRGWMWYCADTDARRIHERVGESADFRANVLHPGGTGWEVRAEAREVRGRKDARDCRCDEDGGHAESRGAGGAGDRG